VRVDDVPSAPLVLVGGNNDGGTPALNGPKEAHCWRPSGAVQEQSVRFRDHVWRRDEPKAVARRRTEHVNGRLVMGISRYTAREIGRGIDEDIPLVPSPLRH
jgi:hypothetical protein